MTETCPICRETDPSPAWFCTRRAAGIAKLGEPCAYSVEGHARMREKFAATQAVESQPGGVADGEI